MQPLTLPGRRYSFPQRCCGCLGDPSGSVKVESRWQEGSFVRSFVVDVPVCDACQRDHKRKIVLLVGSCLAAPFVGAGSFALFMGSKGLLPGALFFFALAVSVVMSAANGLQLATFDQRGRLNFKNKEYEKLFSAANPVAG